MIPLFVIVVYLVILLGIGAAANRSLSGTSNDYFLASRSIGPVLLLMSLFGTTMTAFAMVGSTGEAYVQGIGVYGLMASWAAVVHPAMFAFIGVPVWHLGRKHGYVTQIQLLRDRFRSEALGWLLFPMLVGLVIPYLLIGVQGAGVTVAAVTKGAFPTVFMDAAGAPSGLPPWLTGLVICAVVLMYVFFGGIRAAAWANGFQTAVFVAVSMLTLVVLSEALGGPAEAIARAAEKRPELLVRGEVIGYGHFLTYGLVPFSVGMFPHLFQHWLTARSAASFKLTVVAHPLLVAAVWLPCVLIGVWAAGVIEVPPERSGAVLGMMVAKFTSPWMSGVMTAGVLAAIMSSLDSQFMCLGTMFTHDVVLRRGGEVSEERKVWLGRAFVVAIVAITYALSLVSTKGIFQLGVWCFSGFSGLTPIIFAALYWRRATAYGAIASVLATATTWSAFFVTDMMRGAHDEMLVGGVMPVVFIFGASASAMIGVSLFTPPPPQEAIERFFPPQRA
jgi:SSS family solute:Na+ symporter